ncbi:MAG: heavy-metal-associated domain-containing protein [Ferruginibacter sp.]
MRFLTLLFIACIGFSMAGRAQQQKAVEKAVIKTPTVMCEVCHDRVEFFISHEEGVASVSVNIIKHTTTVSWYTDRTTLNNIRTAIANLGYDADDEEAEEYAFKRLPKTCQAHKDAAKAAAQKAATPAKN